MKQQQQFLSYFPESLTNHWPTKLPRLKNSSAFLLSHPPWGSEGCLADKDGWDEISFNGTGTHDRQHMTKDFSDWQESRGRERLARTHADRQKTKTIEVDGKRQARRKRERERAAVSVRVFCAHVQWMRRTCRQQMCLQYTMGVLVSRCYPEGGACVFWDEGHREGKF